MANYSEPAFRCTRSCFQCPVCIGSPLAIASIDKPAEPTLVPPEGLPSPPTSQYVLTCTYCNWSTTEIGVKFEKSSGLYSQLLKIRNGGQPKLSAREYREKRKEDRDAPPLPDSELDADLQFANLKAFYQAQLADINASAGGGLSSLGDLGFSSPGTLSRIMSLYTGGSLGGKRNMGKSTTMREALTTDDGLKLAQLDESAAVDKLLNGTWYDTVSTEQREAQSTSTKPLVSLDDLRPVPTLLRTKRSKRCPVCRHIITKPDAKVTSTRYRIRLVASHYVPTISIRPLISSAQVPNTPSVAIPSPRTPATPQAQQAPLLLRPGQTAQFILTFKNPIFEEVKVTLGTPPRTPGRFPSKVTVLCPQFTIGANTDMWDDALKDDYKDPSKRHTVAGSSATDDGSGQGVAGKVWDRGRNWVSIIVEVVPASLRLDGLKWAKGEGEDVDDSPLREDEDMLEIPMFMRVEWEAETQEVGSMPGKDKNAKEKRELAYWSVLGVGKIMQE